MTSRSWSGDDRGSELQALGSPRHRTLFGRPLGDILIRAALGIGQVAALLWFSSAVNGFPLDDAWIHQVVARTLARYGTLGYAPGQHGAAATSYLWALVLGANLKWLHIDPVRFAFAVNAAMAILGGQLLYDTLARVRPAHIEATPWRGACFVATAFAWCSGNVLWFAHSGMEANGFVALSALAVWAATHERGQFPQSLLAGFAAGLVALVRPEGIPLGALLGAWAFARRRSWSNRAAILSPWLVAVCAYVAVNVANSGHASPATLSGRRWLWFEVSQGQSHIDLVAAFAEFWMGRLRHYVLEGGIVSSWIAVGIGSYGALSMLRLPNPGVRLLFAWAACHTALYAALLPAGGHGGRYQPLLPLLFVVSVVFGTVLFAWDATRVLARRARLDVLVAGALVWAIPLVGGASAMKVANDLSIRHIERTERGAGDFVRHLPQGDRVASFDIGAIGWVSDRPILDLGGLSDPNTIGLLESGRISELLAARGVRFVVLPEGYEPHLTDEGNFRARLGLQESPGLRLEPAFRLFTPRATWEAMIDATSCASPGQIVYAVERVDDGPAPPRVDPPPSRASRPIADPEGLVSRTDKAVVEHALAVLDAWGLAVDVRVASAAVSNAEPDRARCEVAFGAWGAAVNGCAPMGGRRLAEAAIFEGLGRFLAVDDVGGAARAIPHALARAMRRKDPTFLPVLAPTRGPRWGGAPSLVERTARWGVPLAIGVVLVAFGISWPRSRSRVAAFANRLANRLRRRAAGEAT